MQKIILGISLMLTSFCLAGCGKYGSPLTPESLSPTAVDSLAITTDIEGVSFAWKAPEKDQRSKDLKSMDGYAIWRKKIEKDSDVLNPDVEFEKLIMIEDTHVKELIKLREEARDQGKPSHRVKVDTALTRFQFKDVTVQPGQRYVYKVVPMNQDGVEGAVTQLIQVLFRGETSEVRTIAISDLDSFEFGSNV